MTTYDERQQKGLDVCQKLTERIGEVAAAVPLGYWPPIADAPSAAFMDALSAWEIDPSKFTMQRVTVTYGCVIEAWRVAASEFSAERSEA